MATSFNGYDEPLQQCTINGSGGGDGNCAQEFKKIVCFRRYKY